LTDPAPKEINQNKEKNDVYNAFGPLAAHELMKFLEEQDKEADDEHIINKFDSDDSCEDSV